MQALLIATHNPGKIEEYRLLLADLPLQITSLAEREVDFEVPETGDTFAANACIKAQTYAKISGLWTWADDSGLEVDSLGGRPGVLSARYGGPGLSDRDRYERLLGELSAIPPQERTARFRCAVCVAKPDGDALIVEDSVEGVITSQPAGDHGFGYDPVFFVPEHGLTMAQLPADLKNEISHRGKAARTMKRHLAEHLQDRRQVWQD